MSFEDLLARYKIKLKEGDKISSFYRKAKPLLVPSGENSEMTEAIFDLFSNSVIRRGDGNLYHSVIQNYLKQIDFFVQKRDPVELVFLGMPFKCHNPMETTRRTPDLGELAFLVRLMDIDATIRQIYEPGLHFTVLTEGRVYKDYFGATVEEIRAFEARLSDFIYGLNGGKIVSLVDFSSVCACFPEFEKLRQQREEFMGTRRSEGSLNQEIKARIPVMMRSVPILEGVPIEDLLAVHNYKESSQSLTAFQRELREHLLVEAEELAIKYLAFQEAKSKLGVIPKSFPEKLYVSTTAKIDRYSFHPIHRRTRFFPHHGVPVLDSEKVDIIFLGDILRNPQNFSAVFCPDDIDKAPFYFIKWNQFIKMLK